MENLWRDLRFAGRMLSKGPVFALIAVLSLALGIGANTAVFSLLDAIFLTPLPIAEQDRVMAIFTVRETHQPFSLSHLDWRDVREQNDSFEQIAGYDWTGMSVSTGKETFHVTGQLASGNYFETLGAQAARGRTFGPADDQASGGHPVAVLTHRFWTRRLGSDPQVVGRTLRINGQPFTVIGVMPPELAGLLVGIQPELWVPMAMNPVIQPDPSKNWYETRRGLFLKTFGRLRPGVTPESAEDNLQAIARRLERQYPESNAGRSFQVTPIAETRIVPWAREGAPGGAALLMATAALVLLIACVNLATLLLARATERRREVAVRLALGVRRSRLIRQLLTESLLISLVGGALGLGVAYWAQGALLRLLATVPSLSSDTFSLELELIDGRILAFTLGLTLLTGLLFGLVPALQASRPRLIAALKEGAEVSLGGGRKLSARKILIVTQVALSLVALLGAGLFLRSLREARRIDPGFDPDHLVAISLDLSLQGYSETQGQQLYRRLVERGESLPGVASAAICQFAPLAGSWHASVLPAGHDLDDSPPAAVQFNLVDPDYFSTLGITLDEGRGFTEADREDSVPVAVVNRNLADLFFPGRSAVGQRLTVHSMSREVIVEIVGIARDVKYNRVDEDPQPYLYLPMHQRYVASATLLVRTESDPEPILGQLRQEIRALDPELALIRAETTSEVLSNTLWVPRLAAVSLAIFGAIALGLAAIGIYGVMSYGVNRRQREIGIRVALGAPRVRVFLMILRQSLALLAWGLAAGLLLAYFGRRLVAAMLHVPTSDPPALLGALAALSAIAVAASLLPALRAARVDPIQALRSE